MRGGNEMKGGSASREFFNFSEIEFIRLIIHSSFRGLYSACVAMYRFQLKISVS